MNLSDKEVKFYLSLLMLGQSAVNSVAKKANLNRVTTYDILKSLLERGFVSYVIISGVKHFEAVESSKFLDSLKEKQAKIEAVYLQMRFIEEKFDITKISYGDKVAFLTFKEKTQLQY